MISTRTYRLCGGAAVLLAMGLLARPAAAQLIGTVDDSETFTVAQQGGKPERTDGVFGIGSPGYDVEVSHGNPTSTWIPDNSFSFNTGLGSACCGYHTNDGNAGL